jgi:hypothetical protein
MSIIFLKEYDFSLSELVDKKLINNIESDELAYILGIQGNYRNTKIGFVGLIETQQNIIFSFPKFENNKDTAHPKLIIDLFKRVSSESNPIKKPIDSFLFDDKNNNNKNISRIGIERFLLDDFYKNGLLTIKRKYIKKSQNRSPDWSRTIELLDPIQTEHGPIYDNWLSRHSENISHKIVTEVHRSVIAQSTHFYGKLLGYPENIALGNTTNLSIDKSALPILRLLLRRTYNARETSVIKALISWILESRPNGLRIFGTQYFHTIWELICCYLFSDIKDTDRWRSVMPKAEWITSPQGEIFKSSRTFMIDALTELPDDSGVLLIDAKYYLPQFINGKVENGPSINDISKQLHYEELIYTSDNFVTQYGNNRSKIFNYFIFPGDSDQCDLSLLGKITIPRITKNKINYATYSGNKAIMRFLKRNPLSDFELITFASGDDFK